MYGEQHPLVQKTGPTRIVWGLSLVQLLALGAGGILSYRLAQVIPPLPFKNFVVAHVHHLIPLGLAAFLCFAREAKTGLNLAAYLLYLLAFKLRPRTFIWRR